MNKQYFLNTREVGLIFTINCILITLIQVPLTNLVNKSDFLIVAAIGVFLIGFGLGILPLGSTFSFAVLSCLIWTLGEMLFFPICTTLILNHIDSFKKGKYLSVYEAASSAARIVFPSMGMIAYEKFNGNIIWVTSFIAMLIATAGYLVLNENVKLFIKKLRLILD